MWWAHLKLRHGIPTGSRRDTDAVLAAMSVTNSYRSPRYADLVNSTGVPFVSRVRRSMRNISELCAIESIPASVGVAKAARIRCVPDTGNTPELRSEEHTSELQSLMRISYAVFCLK